METVTAPATIEALSEAGQLNADERAVVTEAHRMQSAILQFSRLALDAPLSEETASPALSAAISRALELDDFAAVMAELMRVQQGVSAIFETQFGQ